MSKCKSVKVSNNPEETILFAARLAGKLKPGAFIGLTGELGSGKTVFTKGIAKGLGVRKYAYVNSPTFVIIKEYKGRLPLYHFDIYRIDSTDDLETVGYEDYFYGKGVTVVEWADKIKDLLPAERIEVELSHAGEHRRRIRVRRVHNRV